MSDPANRNYEVGYGKPPTSTRWKPGQSGNPKGPKGKKKAVEATLNVLLHEAVNEIVRVEIGGRDVFMPKKQWIAMCIVDDALQGTPNQRLKAMKVLHDMGAFNRNVEDDRVAGGNGAQVQQVLWDMLKEAAAQNTEYEAEARKNYDIDPDLPISSWPAEPPPFGKA